MSGGPSPVPRPGRIHVNLSVSCHAMCDPGREWVVRLASGSRYRYRDSISRFDVADGIGLRNRGAAQRRGTSTIPRACAGLSASTIQTSSAVLNGVRWPTRAHQWGLGPKRPTRFCKANWGRPYWPRVYGDACAPGAAVHTTPKQAGTGDDVLALAGRGTNSHRPLDYYRLWSAADTCGGLTTSPSRSPAPAGVRLRS